MSKTYDCIVIGLGGIGSAALYFAAKRGWKTLGLDRFPAGHARGSSHGDTRIIRQAYFEYPAYVPLAKEAYGHWELLQEESGKSLLQQTGLLQVGHPDGVVIQGVERAAVEHDLPLQRFDTAELRAEYPQFNVRDGDVGLLEQVAGYLRVERCIETFLELAQANAAEARFDVQVQEWKEFESNGFSDYEVVTDQGTFLAKRLIVCGGAWSGGLLPQINFPLNVIAKHQHWFQFQDERTTLQSDCPVFFFETDEGYFYGFPDIDGEGNKIAEHSGGFPVTDPMNVDRELKADDLQRVQEFCHQYFNSPRPVRVRHSVCMYTMSPDEHFIVDRLGRDGFACVAGLSGHGFKFSPALGKALVEIAAGQLRPDIDFLSLNRFNERVV